jgi:hypothetical protein
VQCSVVWCSVVQCSAVWYKSVSCNHASRGEVRSYSLPCTLHFIAQNVCLSMLREILQATVAVQCDSVAVWQCGSVAVWQCGSVAVE